MRTKIKCNFEVRELNLVDKVLRDGGALYEMVRSKIDVECELDDMEVRMIANKLAQHAFDRLDKNEYIEAATAAYLSKHLQTACKAFQEAWADRVIGKVVPM